MIGEQRDVFLPIAQRRHENRDDVQAEVEILAEAAGADLGLQILVGRRQHARVHLDPRRPADRLHRLLLQHAQHLGLRLQAHVADLVEEDRAAVGDLELAAPIRDGAGERAAHVAEQLALDQLFGNRRAVDLDERRRPAPAQRVDRARDELLAGAVLAVDEHAAVGRRRHRHLLAQLAHRVALAHHRLVAIDAGAQRAVLGLEPALPQRVADDEDGLLERQRLLDEVERAHLDRADRRLDVAVAGDEDDLRVDLPLAQPRQRREAVHARQPDVEHDQIDRPARDALEALFAARDGLDGVALVAQHAAQRRPHAGLVVDDQDGGFHRRSTTKGKNSLVRFMKSSTAARL